MNANIYIRVLLYLKSLMNHYLDDWPLIYFSCSTQGVW